MKNILVKSLIGVTVILLSLVSTLPAQAQTVPTSLAPTCTGSSTLDLCTYADFISTDGGGFLNVLITFLIFGLAVPLATFAILWAGFKMVTNPAKSDVRAQAKKTMQNAVLGLLLVLTAYVLVKFLVASLTDGVDYYELLNLFN